MSNMNSFQDNPTQRTAIQLLQSHSLTTLAQQEIARLIETGELSAGDKLNEWGVAERLGVSRGPVREAFRALMRYLYQPYLEDAPFEFRRHRPEDTFKRMFTENPNLFKLNMPADAVFFGPDTYRFARAIKAALKERTAPIANAVDIGCGAGPGGILVAKHAPEARVLMTDINEAALRLARVNAALAGTTNAIAKRTDILLDVEGTFDLIVSNPPYIRSGEIATLATEVRDYDPLVALDGGKDGLDAYRAILPQALQQVDAIQTWKHQVEQHEVVGPGCRLEQAVRTGFSFIESPANSSPSSLKISNESFDAAPTAAAMDDALSATSPASGP